MRRSYLRRLALFILCVFSAAAGQAPQPTPTALSVGSASLGMTKGEVNIISPQGKRIRAQRGQVLDPETTIEVAKGSVLLNLQDGSQVLIQKHSRVVLKAANQDGGHFFDLLLGKILAKIKKRLAAAPSFKMGTPTAVITVRGTEFTVQVDKKTRTTVEVYQGLVEVAGLAAMNHPILLRPGFWIEVPRNERPQSPRRMSSFGSDSSDDRSLRRMGEGDESNPWNPLGGGGRQSSQSERSGEHDH